MKKMQKKIVRSQSCVRQSVLYHFQNYRRSSTFSELDGKEGILVASKVADRVGITRSVIVNALRKFESAGVIEARSSGMKGTYIKVLNDVVFDELKAV